MDHPKYMVLSLPSTDGRALHRGEQSKGSHPPAVGQEAQPRGERRQLMELLLVIVILLVIFGGFGFSRR